MKYKIIMCSELNFGSQLHHNMEIGFILTYKTNGILHSKIKSHYPNNKA